MLSPHISIKTYDISELRDNISWQFLYYAWGMIKATDEEKAKLRNDANALLDKWQGKVSSRYKLIRSTAYSEGDDIIVNNVRLPMLRQQSDEFLSLADYIAPKELGHTELGLFVATVDAHMPELQSDDAYERMLAQTLCDRMAEATSEKVSQEMAGIRPAAGYPSLPDISINFLLDKLIDMSEVAVSLTDTGMMMPHATTSGLVFTHPKAKYFSIGEIGEDQLCDYAHRRGIDKDVLRKYLRNIQL